MLTILDVDCSNERWKVMNISVLMSVYKNERPDYLKESIASVTINQTIQPAEFVLIQDGPLTNELYDVIEYFSKTLPYFKTYSLTTNVGLGKALQYGVEKCSYDWIARMDSDDIAVPTRFEKQINFIKEHPSVDVLGSNITEFGQDIHDIVSVKKMPVTHEAICQMLKRRTPLCHMTVMLKKDAVLHAGNYKALPFVEDYYLWVRMYVAGAKFHSLDESLVFARVGNGMIARRGNKEQIKSWKVINNLLYENNIISRVDKLINMLLITGFVYLPPSLKQLVYLNALRSKKG